MNDKMYDAVDEEQVEPYSVLIHGDFWTTNMNHFFKYDQDGKPCDICFTDFQMCRYASSPFIDLVYTLFYCCTQETRSKYYDQLLHEYHESLSKYLENFGYNSKDLFPYEVLWKHLLKFGIFG